MQIVIGVFLGVLIGFAAYKLGALSVSGAVAAAVVGGMIFGLGGLPWAVLLLLFFISSSLLSRAYSRRKQDMKERFEIYKHLAAQGE